MPWGCAHQPIRLARVVKSTLFLWRISPNVSVIAHLRGHLISGPDSHSLRAAALK